MKATKVTENLLNQLASTDENIRSQAVLALGQAGDENAIPALIDVLINDGALNVQEDATWALTKFGAAAVDPLVVLLAHPNSHVRHNAVHTLGKIGNARTIEALMPLLNDPEGDVRLKTVYVMGQLKAVSVAALVLERLADDIETIRTTAFEVLENMGEAVLPNLLHGLTHDNALVREASATLIGLTENADSVEALSRLLTDDNLDVRLATIQALGDIGGDAAAQHLATLTDNDNKTVRVLASGMLKRMEI